MRLPATSASCGNSKKQAHNRLRTGKSRTGGAGSSAIMILLFRPTRVTSVERMIIKETVFVQVTGGTSFNAEVELNVEKLDPTNMPLCADRIKFAAGEGAHMSTWVIVTSE